MKKFLVLALACGAALAAPAQVFRPEIVQGALLGGLAGAVIGHNDGRHGWEGAAYGAAAGALLGAVVGDANDQRWHGDARPGARTVYRDRVYRDYNYATTVYGRAYRPWGDAYYVVGYGPSWSYPRHRHGWGYGYSRYPRHHYRDYSYVSFDGNNRVTGGALFGAGLGAIIGHNQGRRGWEGAAYGAVAGAVIGSLTERAATRSTNRVFGDRHYEPAVGAATPSAEPAPAVTAEATVPAAPASVMSSANALFGR